MGSKVNYKRKFVIPSNTPRTCRDFCGEKWLDEGVPCAIEIPIWNSTRTLKQMSKKHCPHKSLFLDPEDDRLLFKPKDYIVSEMEDGTWRCSCPRNVFKREECKHITKAKTEPEKYEIDKSLTAKGVELFNKIFE